MTNIATASSVLSLYSEIGERKYISQAERKRFLKSLPVLKNPSYRSFCEMIFWTGCRPSEALGLTPLHIDLAEKLVVIRSLKKRGALKGRHFRPVPVPERFLERLESVHQIRAAQGDPVRAVEPLWPFGRTTAWRKLKRVMNEAGIVGIRATNRGLRHAYGVNAAVNAVPGPRIRTCLGHSNMATTAIYMDALGPDDHRIARRMWSARETSLSEENTL